MFIYCNDEEVKNKMLNSGYKLLKEQEGVYVFANNNKIKFDNSLEKQVMFSNRLTF